MAMDKERDALVALDRHEVMVAYEYMKERNFPDIAACHVIQRAAAALSAPQPDGVVVPRDVLKRCREAMWAYAPVTAALTKSDDPLVRELDALLAAKEPRK